MTNVCSKEGTCRFQLSSFLGSSLRSSGVIRPTRVYEALMEERF